MKNYVKLSGEIIKSELKSRNMSGGGKQAREKRKTLNTCDGKRDRRLYQSSMLGSEHRDENQRGMPRRAKCGQEEKEEK